MKRERPDGGWSIEDLAAMVGGDPKRMRKVANEILSALYDIRDRRYIMTALGVDEVLKRAHLFGADPRTARAIWEGKLDPIAGSREPCQPPPLTRPERDSNPRFVRHEDAEQLSTVLAEELVPLDNRHGTSALVSEHEFTRTVRTTLRLDRETTTGAELHAGLWSVAEAEVRRALTESTGIELGSEVTRRVMLRFEAAAGASLCYKVTWIQSVRTGRALFDSRQGDFRVSYTCTLGIYHSVESVKVDP